MEAPQLASHRSAFNIETVNQQVYIACGISGAIKHFAGMKGSDIIGAINSDPKAPVFEVVQVGIIGDLFRSCPN